MICPRCQSTEYYILQGRKTVRCKQCSHEFSETSGTVWRSSKLDPQKREAVIDLLNAGKNRHAISIATGLQYKTVCLIAERRHAERQVVVEPKREYCGPYLIALPPPAWLVRYVPTVPPYRIVVSSQGYRSLQGLYEEQREGISNIWDIKIGADEIAELLDANDDWIVQVFYRKPKEASLDGQREAPKERLRGHVRVSARLGGMG